MRLFATLALSTVTFTSSAWAQPSQVDRFKQAAGQTAAKTPAEAAEEALRSAGNEWRYYTILSSINTVPSGSDATGALRLRVNQEVQELDNEITNLTAKANAVKQFEETDLAAIKRAMDSGERELRGGFNEGAARRLGQSMRMASLRMGDVDTFVMRDAVQAAERGRVDEARVLFEKARLKGMGLTQPATFWRGYTSLGAKQDLQSYGSNLNLTLDRRKYLAGKLETIGADVSKLKTDAGFQAKVKDRDSLLKKFWNTDRVKNVRRLSVDDLVKMGVIKKGEENLLNTAEGRVSVWKRLRIGKFLPVLGVIAVVGMDAQQVFAESGIATAPINSNDFEIVSMDYEGNPPAGYGVERGEGGRPAQGSEAPGTHRK